MNLFNDNFMGLFNKSRYMEDSPHIIIILDSNGDHRILILGYGRITVENIRPHTQRFIGHPTRQAQTFIQMYHCILNYPSKEVNLNIVSEVHKY